MSKPTTPTITAFERSPDRGKGLARDMRVRWALEEVGQPYDVRLLSFAEMKQAAHRRRHDGAFSAGDLLMVTVLRRLDGSGLLEKYPSLCAYIARGEARPAYQRAFEDQLAVFADSRRKGGQIDGPTNR